MVDTIRVWFPKEDGLYDFESHINRLSNVAVHSSLNSPINYSGNLRNMRVWIGERGVSITGSLPKYLLNNNVNSIGRQDIERGFEQMSDEFRLPLKKSKVSWLDLGCNFQMQYEPESYFSLLGTCNRYSRSLWKNSVYYSNTNRTLLFYNKGKEQKKKDFGFLLRYELRYRKSLDKQFNLSPVYAFDIYQQKFYTNMIEKYVSEYERISKVRSIRLDKNHVNSPKDFWRQIELQGLLAIGGIEQALELVNELKRDKAFKNCEYYSRIRSRIKGISNDKNLTEGSGLIEELNEKIRDLKVTNGKI